jgi:hypothetical protein
MQAEANTLKKVKIKPEEIVRMRKALPYRSLNIIAEKLGISKQIIHNNLSRIPIFDITDDGSVKIDRKITEEAIKLLHESGNNSFDYLITTES